MKVSGEDRLYVAATTVGLLLLVLILWYFLQKMNAW